MGRAEAAPKVLVGRARPRIAPPLPVRSDAKRYIEQATEIGIVLFPWQLTALRYATARFGSTFLYREVAELVARQNGKTEKLRPIIVRRLRDGRRIMHTAQDRTLPREVFDAVADDMERHYADELVAIRRANGQEEITTRNGGSYRIVAPTRKGARGYPNDDVIVDEARELEDWEFIAAAKPTMTASADPQILYLSNAGTVESVVLAALRARSEKSDPDLAFLEWSADPGRRADDMDGWLEANPSYGHLPGIARSLESEYRAAKLGGSLATFETEHLCRSVASMRELLVPLGAWTLLEADIGAPKRAALGLAVAPEGTRASAAVAWKLPDQSLAVRVLADVSADGDLDVDRLAVDLKREARAAHCVSVAFDPLTDAQLAKHFAKGFGKPKSITGREHAAASARFATEVAGARLHWAAADAVTDDLTWTARKAHDETGSFQAVRADDDRPITASLAAIRAVWLASTPNSGIARVW